MIQYRLRALVPAFACTLALLTLTAGSAHAKDFAGQIITSDKPIPTTAKSKKEYQKKLRKIARTTFSENKETKQWKIYFAAFFKSKLNDLEVTVKIYDVTGGQRRMVAAFEQWLSDRNQREIISNIKLDREKFGVNRQLLMTVENRGKVLAQGKFKIAGEAEKYSGKVEFSEEEASGSE